MIYPGKNSCLPQFVKVNPLTTGPAQLLSMQRQNVINQQAFKLIDIQLSNLNYFYSLEFVNRVSDAQLQVGENSNQIILRLKR